MPQLLTFPTPNTHDATDSPSEILSSELHYIKCGDDTIQVCLRVQPLEDCTYAAQLWSTAGQYFRLVSESPHLAQARILDLMHELYPTHSCADQCRISERLVSAADVPGMGENRWLRPAAAGLVGFAIGLVAGVIL